MAARPIPKGPAWFRTGDLALERAASLFQTCAEIMLAVMLVINFANIVLRNSGFSSLLWVSPWTGVLMVWSVFLAFFVMYRRHLDIALVLVVDRFGARGRRLARILTALVGLVVVGILLAEAPQILKRQRGIMEMVELSRYWLSVPLLASCLMLFFHFLHDLIGLSKGWIDDLETGDTEATQW